MILKQPRSVFARHDQSTILFHSPRKPVFCHLNLGRWVRDQESVIIESNSAFNAGGCGGRELACRCMVMSVSDTRALTYIKLCPKRVLRDNKKISPLSVSLIQSKDRRATGTSKTEPAYVHTSLAWPAHEPDIAELL